MTKQNISLTEQLEEEIITGVFSPGEHLDEIGLAKRFGVSRTPIREALFQLATVGFVERKPRKGNFVAEIGPKKLVEMFDVMAELEAMCAKLAARRTTQEQLNEILDAHKACCEISSNGDADQYYYLNEIFHSKIRNAAGNTFLIEQTEQLHKRLRAYRRLQLRTRGRIKTSFEEHNDIVEAIKDNEPEKAAEIMRSHVLVQGERFVDLISSLVSSKPNH